MGCWLRSMCKRRSPLIISPPTMTWLPTPAIGSTPGWQNHFLMRSQGLATSKPQGLNAELHRYLDLALANKALFPNRYLRADGRYEINRQLGEMWADVSPGERPGPGWPC